MFAPASIKTKTFVSVGRTAAIPGRSIPVMCGIYMRARRYGRAGVASADDGVGLTVLDQIHRTTDGRIFFPAHRGPGAIAHVDDLS